MPVSASKLVTLAQLQAQAERVKQELAKYTLASELGSLAKKSEISEADLSAALKSVTPSRTLLAISPLWALPQLILRPIPK